MRALVALTIAKLENGQPLVGKRGELCVEIPMHWLNGSAKNHVVIVLVSKQIFLPFYFQS